MAYYRQLRHFLRHRPELRDLLVRCRLCHIFFLTHPRNAGRCDLRCHFGCQAHDQARKSADRSADYYRSEQGKAKKRELNVRRGRGLSETAPNKDSTLVSEATAQPAPGPVAEPANESANHAFPPFVSYLAMLLTLIELRSVMPGEIAELLRQQGIDLAPLRPQYRRGRGRGPP